MANLVSMFEMSCSLKNKLDIGGAQAHSNRRLVIDWMKKICDVQQIYSPTQVRDLAVQIFDSYCVTHADVLIDGEIAEVVGACCILLSSKMEGELTTQSSFAHIDPHYLGMCEVHVLKMINFCIIPNATPFAFVKELLEMPHPCEQSESVAQVANDYIGSFLDDPKYLLYAPSTIAMSALILVFRKRDESDGCDEWLRRIPGEFFPEHKGSGPLDLDGCVKDMHSALSRNLLEHPKSERVFDSPVTVACEFDEGFKSLSLGEDVVLGGPKYYSR